MDGLNYHHLLYFWKVAKTGSIAKASAELKLTQPTVSEQIRLLENSLDRKLFDRVGRSLALTETGKNVYGYAEKIFALGGELTNSLQGIETEAPPTICVGIERGLPEDIVALLLARLLAMKPRPVLELRHGTSEDLRKALASGTLDVVLATSGTNLATGKGHAQLLVECGTVFLASKAKRSKRWLASLDGQPFLLPETNFGEELQAWFDRKKIAPRIAARSESAAVLLAVARLGPGTLAVPDLKKLNNRGFAVLGRTNEIRFRFYAITRERRPRNPYVAALLAAQTRRRG